MAIQQIDEPATRHPGGQVVLHDFRPHRRDPRLAALLLGTAARVGAEFGVALPRLAPP